MKQEELKKVLELHKKWLNHEPDGVRANLCGRDLWSANLRGLTYGQQICVKQKTFRSYPMRAQKKVSLSRLRNVGSTLLNSLFQQTQNAVLGLRGNAEQAMPRCFQSQQF